MLYARVRLVETDYKKLKNYEFIDNPDIELLNSIYRKYCRYKKFKSVMPIFDSEYTENNNDIIGYYYNSKLVAFSLLKRYDSRNVEAIQFAWDYNEPRLKLGIESLKNECALYKEMGFEYLYLGYADEYKKQIDGFEILGSI